jgi:hypothetical protein
MRLYEVGLVGTSSLYEHLIFVPGADGNVLDSHQWVSFTVVLDKLAVFLKEGVEGAPGGNRYNVLVNHSYMQFLTAQHLLPPVISALEFGVY